MSPLDLDIEKKRHLKRFRLLIELRISLIHSKGWADNCSFYLSRTVIKVIIRRPPKIKKKLRCVLARSINESIFYSIKLDMKGTLNNHCLSSKSYTVDGSFYLWRSIICVKVTRVPKYSLEFPCQSHCLKNRTCTKGASRIIKGRLW